MARDPLRILLSMRLRSVEQARAAMGVCLAAEAEVAGRIRLLDDALRRDRETSGAWQDAHQFLEMSATHLEVVRAERRTAAMALAAAALHSEEARGVVTAARTAAEAVEQLVSERETASRVEAAKREQHALDDMSRARYVVGQRGRTH
jgi:flagellar biosynthesis chaperone FliJ